MREADLARPRLRSTADQRGVRDRVMRRAERAIGQQARAWAAAVPATECTDVTSSASSIVSGGRMPATRRAIIVLPAPGGPISSRLCPPAAAISSARRASSCPRTSARSSASRRAAAAGWPGRRTDGARRIVERADRFGERRHAEHVEARDDRRLAGVRRGQQNRRQCRRASPPRRSAARRGCRGSIRRATARRGAPISANMPALDDTGRRQDAQRDREIERGAGLADIGRREVDGDPVRRELEPGVADRALHAIAALRTLASGRPDHRERRHAERHVDLDVHRASLYAEDRSRSKTREHITLTLQASSPQKSSPNRFNDLESSTASRIAGSAMPPPPSKCKKRRTKPSMQLCWLHDSLQRFLIASPGSQRTCWTPSRI